MRRGGTSVTWRGGGNQCRGEGGLSDVETGDLSDVDRKGTSVTWTEEGTSVTWRGGGPQ